MVMKLLKIRAEQRSPTIYLGGGQNFLSEIGLFRRLGGTELFASRVHSGSTIELGEYVQLRSIVRAGDGKGERGGILTIGTRTYTQVYIFRAQVGTMPKYLMWWCTGCAQTASP